jgi:hypothetical protein
MYKIFFVKLSVINFKHDKTKINLEIDRIKYTIKLKIFKSIYIIRWNFERSINKIKK